MSDKADVVVGGHICLDIIPAFETQQASQIGDLIVPGKLVKMGPAATATGGASNAGLALHALGLKTSLMCKVGNDLIGEATLSALKAVDPALAEGMLRSDDASSYSVIMSPPGIDRTFLHCPGCNDTFVASDVDYEALDGVKLFHFGYPPIMREMYLNEGKELADMFHRVKELKVITALDMTLPDVNSEAGQLDWRPVLENALKYVDVFLPSIEEILLMLRREKYLEICAASETGEVDIAAQITTDLLRELADELIEMGVCVVVIKLGDQGLYVRTDENLFRFQQFGHAHPTDLASWLGRELMTPCFNVDVVGTTGSGDCTVAGFLAGLVKDLPLEECMKMATAVGAFNCEAADATSGVKHWDVVSQRVNEGWTRKSSELAKPGWSENQKRNSLSGLRMPTNRCLLQ